jgi:diguanylate cyclase (GGDEF)-like protein/PAS domain S-box-containing protein
VAYLLLLLGSTFVSQQYLRQASDNALLFNLEKRASALSYFHSERNNDIVVLAKDHVVSAFFSNRALGMSMEYGLRASLFSMQELFQEIVEKRKLNNAPIYLRLQFIENDGNHLVDVGLSKGEDVDWLKKSLVETQKTTSFVVRNGEHNQSIILFPYFYKEKRMGSIVAEINRDEVLRYLISPKASENTQYALLVKNSRYILHREQDKKLMEHNGMMLLGCLCELPVDGFGSFVKMPVSGTPFVLAARYYHKNTPGTFLASRWYLVSLIILAILVFASLVVRTRTRTNNLLLQARSEESDRQRIFLTEKNKLLDEEVQKRLNSEARLRFVLETIPDLVWVKDPEGLYLSCNPKFERFFGASEEDIVGKTDYDFVDKELADFFREKDKAAMDAGKSLTNEETVTYADDGHEETLETIRTLLRDSKGKLIGILGIARDITARKQAEEKFHYFSVHDPLTGLYNRRVLEERIADEIHRAKRYHHNIAIFMLDIDHFKMINDTYGHQNGDMVLCHLAELLKASIRKTDYVARYGGEEFIVVLPEASLLKSKELAERLCAQIAQTPITIDGNKQIRMTVSIGVAIFPEYGKSWKELLAAADSAMYAAKRSGRNQVKFP